MPYCTNVQKKVKTNKKIVQKINTEEHFVQMRVLTTGIFISPCGDIPDRHT